MPLSSTAAQMPPWLRCNRVRGSRLLALFASVLVPLYLFGALAEDVIEKEAFGFDLYPLLFMHSHATPLLDSVMVAFSLWGSGLAMAPVDALVLLLLARRRRWGEVLFFGVAVGGAAVLNFAAKYAFGRVRPALWLSIAPETTFSFPSGHAMATMALVSALLVLAWPTRWRWLTLTLGTPFVLLVGLSRVYLGVHYPSDIFAGWAASLAWVAGLSAILYRNLTPPAPQATWTSMKCRCCRRRPIRDYQALPALMPPAVRTNVIAVCQRTKKLRLPAHAVNSGCSGSFVCLALTGSFHLTRRIEGRNDRRDWKISRE